MRRFHRLSRRCGEDRAAGLAIRTSARALWRQGDGPSPGTVGTKQSRSSKEHRGAELVMAYGRASRGRAIGGQVASRRLGWAEKAIELAAEIGVANVIGVVDARAIVRGYSGDPDVSKTSGLRSRSRLRARAPAEDTAVAMNNFGETSSSTSTRSSCAGWWRQGLEFARERGLRAPRCGRPRSPYAPCSISASGTNFKSEPTRFCAGPPGTGGGQVEIFATPVLDRGSRSSRRHRWRSAARRGTHAPSAGERRSTGRRSRCRRGGSRRVGARGSGPGARPRPRARGAHEGVGGLANGLSYVACTHRCRGWRAASDRGVSRRLG